jgi:hypothetical protein
MTLEWMDMGTDYQKHRVSIDISKGFRQLQKADSEILKGEINRASSHYVNGLNYFVSAEDHASRVVDADYNKAAEEINLGNKELETTIAKYDDGNVNNTARDYYAKALDHYDIALDLIDSR